MDSAKLRDAPMQRVDNGEIFFPAERNGALIFLVVDVKLKWLIAREMDGHKNSFYELSVATGGAHTRTNSTPAVNPLQLVAN